MKEKLFLEIIIWKRINDDQICRYRVFEDLFLKKYFVKGQDFFHDPLDEKQLRNIEFYSVDSLFQDGLSVERKMFDSIEQAIEQFEEDFK
jgi:hypothetical protein